MKNYLTIMSVLFLAKLNPLMACEIQGKVKKANAKTIYLDSGESMSEKQILKLGCKIKKVVMSERESLLLDISSLEKRLEIKRAKLKSL